MSELHCSVCERVLFFTVPHKCDPERARKSGYAAGYAAGLTRAADIVSDHMCDWDEPCCPNTEESIRAEATKTIT